MKNRALPEGLIEKPEDREWRQWFEKLDKDKHTEYLAKLGLDNEEIRELEEDFEAKAAKEERWRHPLSKKQFPWTSLWFQLWQLPTL